MTNTVIIDLSRVFLWLPFCMSSITRFIIFSLLSLLCNNLPSFCLVFVVCFPLATTDVKENKENDKKADPLKEPPLESEALCRVGTLSDV